MEHFIYTPKSGNRIFSRVTSTDLVLVTWNNGSHHVVGTDLLVELRYAAAAAGNWWRDLAKAAVRGLSCPHVGWDENGRVHVVVRLADARLVADHIRHVSGEIDDDLSDTERNEIEIRRAEVRAGITQSISPINPWDAAPTGNPVQNWPRYGQETPRCIDAGSDGWVALRKQADCPLCLWVGAGPASAIAEAEENRDEAVGVGVYVYHEQECSWFPFNN